MELLLIILIIIGVIVVTWSIGQVSGYLQQRQIAKIENIRKKEREIEEAKEKIEAIRTRDEQDREAIKIIAEEKSQGFPWLAKAYADYFHLRDLKMAEYLEVKLHPALKAAENHRQITKERREAEKAARIADYLLDYCRYLAPWLDEYIGMEAEELDEIIKDIHSSWEKKEKEFDEEAKRHYGPKEYEELITQK